MQGLLGVLSVALEHLRLQLRADRRGVARSAEDREGVQMSSRDAGAHIRNILASLLNTVQHCSPLVPAAGSGMHTGL